MILPGKVITRVFQFSLRNSYKFRIQRISSLVLSKSSYLGHNPTVSSVSKRVIGKAYSVVFGQVRAMDALSSRDPSSFSRPEQAVIKHVSLSLDVDFPNKVLSGVATLNLEVLDHICELILDSSKLNIESIEFDDGEPLKFHIGEEVPNYGSKLTITLNKDVYSGDKSNDECQKSVSLPAAEDDISLIYNGFVYEPLLIRLSEDERRQYVESSANIPCQCLNFNEMDKVNEAASSQNRLTIKIKYSTSPNASALQWLDPSQTSGKTHPYLFSQCQPIHARSILPCQDTPAVKFTYDAVVTAPSHFTVLMSALRGEVQGNTTSFRQPMPLPSYLLAIAVGELESMDLGPRSTVWCEKADIANSAWEFSETEKYLQAAEKLCGKYEWTKYDLLVLPPSFPYGGMENPCLTFVTPTLLAGDRSQADVIVHEIMHSWTGNLVTNRNFEHFWLNEGFTVFLERKVAASLIQDPVEAKKSRDFHSILGLQELTETVVDDLGVNNQLTRLVVDLKGVHPDDAFSTVPYEKGSLFLRYLEDLVGGPEVFDEFLRSYLNQFKMRSLDTDDFKLYLNTHFKDNEKLKEVDWDEWLYKSGMPPVIPDYDTSMTKSVTSLVERIAINATFSSSDIVGFTAHQIIYLLQKLLDGAPLPLSAFKNMEKEYRLEENKNSEIRFRWLRLSIKSKDETKLDEVFKFVNWQGRMKYVRPIYRDLYAWSYARDKAIKNFLENEKYMMHVSAYTLRKDLHLSD